MPLPEIVAELVERYEANRDSYTIDAYKEAHVRKEFIDPFFAALGWDMDNSQGYAEAYKDVIHEDAIKIGGVMKAPDYSFRIGGTRKFFLEAKTPRAILKFDKSAAFQLRRYAWSAKLPLSVLTNFAELAVYDCRFEPNKNDQPSKARLFHLTYKDYAEKWEEIAGIFSKTAVLKGSFDKFAESSKGKRGTAEVDAAFLGKIEEWRDALAHNLALRNPNLSQRELNFAVQQTIDRIVFLRICEDRGMETYGALQSLQNGANCYSRLCDLFRAADERYNSGLFHFTSDKARPEEPDGLTLTLGIDDKTLKDILRGLYYPDSPYVFSVIPADILGQTYEQFLGKVIRLTPGHRAVVEDKPEVKKAGGVYYTPTYIVDYIVQNTLGRLLDGKTPKEAANLRVLDPACGSGSFLIGAFQFLLDWHRDWYVANGGSSKHKKELYEGPGGQWLLKSATRKAILLNSIFGVDIDAQAVEVTKLSLLLKVLEGESAETLNSNLKLFKERALPDLEQNIKCGNSLIGPDFYDGKDPTSFDLDARLKLNAFDWPSAFPQVMKSGGFDAVIGNPPYSNYSARDSMRAFYERHDMTVELQSLTASLAYCSNTYQAVSNGCKDLYKWFTYHALRLSKHAGMLGFIIPNTWLTLPKYFDLKTFVFDAANDIKIVDAGFGVFSVTVPTCLLICSKNSKQASRQYADLKTSPNVEEALSSNLTWSEFSSSAFKSNPLVTKFLELWPEDKRMKSLVTIREGQHIPRSWLSEGHNPDATQIIDSKNMGRYQFSWVPQYSFNAASHSQVKFSTTDQHRIVIRKTGDSIVATLTPSSVSYVLQSLYQSVTFDENVAPRFVLGILNSRFITYIYQNSEFGQKGRTMAQFRKGSLDLMPIPSLRTQANHDKMVSLVERMLKLHQDKAAARLASEKTMLQTQIEATDAQIDRLVYDLYGLTEGEIAVVEGAS